MITLYYDDTSIDIQESEESYRYRALMEKPQLVLKFSLPEYIEFPVGTYCYFQSEKFTVYYPQDIVKNGLRQIEYTITFGNDEQKLGLYKFRNTIDRRLKFSLCAKPYEYLEYIVDNLNDKADSSEEIWAVGSYIDATEQTIEFNHVSIDEALQDVADTFETEWEIVSSTDDDGVTTHTINLQKVEYFTDNPLALSYGKGNGFVPGLGRTTESDELPIKRLYVQGGEDNIDSTEYGSQYLLLPKSQSYEYEGRTYSSDADGYYIERTDEDVDAVKEDSLDCTEIYPSYTHTVTSWTEDDADNNFYTVYDSNTPSDLDYEDCIIGSETMTIIFQSGMLAGREFDVDYTHSTRKFEIVPEDFDGVTMPNSTYCPATGDTFKVFNVYLPDAYICDNDTQTGASWDMMKEACKHLYENEEQKFTFTGTLQSLWAKRNWENVGGYLKIGGYVHFTDTQFATDGVDIRIIGIKDYISNPYAPTIELSNSVSGKSLTSTLREIKATEVVIENTERSVLQYTKRRFRDSAETLEMLQDSLLNYSSAIQPITVQTMALLVGDESLQFQFVTSQSDFTTVTYNITYSDDTQQLTCPEGYLKHCTLGISSISSSHDDSEYLCWHMPEFVSGTLSDGTIGFYLYARVSSTDTTEDGEFLLSASAISMESEDGYYHLLVGILNSENDGSRSYVDLYGYTEVLPGRITTDRIVSSDGNSYLDLVNNAFALSDKLSFNTDGEGKLILSGTLVQSESGDTSTIGCYRGEYDSDKQYYEGDEVYYTDTDTNTTSTYRCIAACSGYAPTNTTYWEIVAKGVAGEDFAWNLLEDSRTMESWSIGSGTLTEAESSDEFASLLLSDSSYTKGQLNTEIVGKQLTLSYELMSDNPDYCDGTTGTAVTVECDFGTTASGATITRWMSYVTDYSDASSWTKYTHTLTPTAIVSSTADYCYFRFRFYAASDAAISIRKVKLEFGDTATVWTPAVADIYGEQGEQGEQGYSPAAVYRGEYSSSSTYYGTTTRRDVVYNSDDSTYYIALTTAGEFTEIDPTDTDYWETFGASFDSVATNLLLAENANIAGFVFRNSRLESQLCTDGTTYTGDTDEDPYIFMNGTTGAVSFSGGKNKFNANGSASMADGNLTIDSSGNVTMKTLTATGATIQGLIYAYSGIKYRCVTVTLSATDSYVTEATSYIYSDLSSVSFYAIQNYYAYVIFYSTATSTTSSASCFAVRLPAKSDVATGWTQTIINQTPYTMWLFLNASDSSNQIRACKQKITSSSDAIQIDAYHSVQVTLNTYWYITQYIDLEDMNSMDLLSDLS